MASATWWQATGLANMYEPSPTEEITVRSGSATCTPSAAASPQPSPPAGPAPYQVPGLSNCMNSRSSGYSFTTTASVGRASDTHFDKYGLVIWPLCLTLAI